MASLLKDAIGYIIIMKYFFLHYDSENMGVFPQGGTIIGHYNVNAPNSFWNVNTNNYIRDLWLPLGVEMKYKAKFTDVVYLSFGAYPFLIISNRMKEHLSRLAIFSPQFFSITLSKKQKRLPYFFFLSYRLFPEYIDFDKSTFFIAEKVFKKVRDLSIKSPEEFGRMVDELKYPYCVRISKFVPDTSRIEYDLFRLPTEARHVVSERFVEMVEREGLTGMKFDPIESAH